MMPPAITPKQVGDLLKASFKRGPWPTESACDRLAAELNSLRKRPRSTPSASNSARNAAIELRKALPERHRYWAAAKTVASPCGTPVDEVADIPGAKLVEDAECALAALDKALHDAMPFIDFPPHTLIKHRRKPEHFVIFHIAAATAKALRVAGRKELSIDRPSPLVDFVVQVLERLGWEPPPHATVATALRRTPAMAWVKQQMAIPPQTKILH